MMRKARDLWRGPLIELLNQEIEDLDQTIDVGLESLDSVMERLPAALASRQKDIDHVLTRMLVGLVHEVDIHAIVHEQLATVTTEQLEQGFREFSDDKLSYITLLGGVFGVIGGTVIVWPLPAIGTLALAVVGLGISDLIAYRVIRSRFWPWRIDPTP